jgi:glycosyltransferase involved in cell wall biosynthesis
LKILFYGELYPDVVHGVSISNRLNIDLLSSSEEVDIIQEQTQVDSIGKTSLAKIDALFSSILRVRKQSHAESYKVFYMVISLSLFGILKTLLVIYSFSLKEHGQIILHLHRGDFVSFYKRHWLNSILIKLCFRRVGRLIVLSENQKNEMAVFFPKRSIFVVENSVLEENKIPIFSDKVGFSSQFLFISNYIKEKGVYDLFSAFEELGDVNLTCYGAFNHNQADLLALKTCNIKINPSIIGLEKFEAIHAADALILPSWNEGQPTIILEAMMLGTLVLTTKVGLIGELLGEDYPFYFNAKNSRDLVACITRFLEYENKEELSKKLKQRYFNFYSQESHQKKLFKAFSITASSEYPFE